MKITKIYKEKFSGKVYNFHCLPSENYFSHNILVHNCYKDNGEDINTHHMTIDEFKIIFHKMLPGLMQIAFGICDIDSNKDFFTMMRYAKEHGVIPNYTCNGLDVTPEIAKKTAELCGAVAVSILNKEKTYNSIKMFSIDNNMGQCNIHYVLSEESYDNAFNIVDDIANDPRLKNMNAIVFLQYKPKGKNADCYHSVLDVEKYTKLIEYCNEKQIKYGFDSCSAHLYMESIKNNKNREHLEMMAEPCESGIFSSYVNCFGDFFVCSFSENVDKWEKGISVLHCNNFIEDVWNHPRLLEWRDRLLNNKRNCPIYNLTLEKV